MTKRTIKELVKTKPKATSGTWRLIDIQDRTQLSEGRDRGIGFGMAKRNGRTLTTVSPISCCKDFASDVCYVEATGCPYNIYGLSYSKQDIYDDHAYMIMAILRPNRQTTKHSTYDKEVAALADNAAHIQSALNHIEGLLKLDDRTVIERIKNNRYAIQFPLWWIKTTYTISLYTLLLRASLFYTGGDPLAYWAALETDDAYMLRDALPKLKRLIAGERPEQDMMKLKTPHSTGICGFQFPAIKPDAAKAERAAPPMATAIQ